MRAVAIVSGGLDSSTLAYKLRSEGHELTILSIDYGQRHRRELEAAQAVASRLDASWVLLNLDKAGIGQVLGSSALTDMTVEVPDGHYAAENMRTTVVPNRNAIFLAVAYAKAAAEGAGIVATAVHAGDHAIYPDCRPEFIAAFAAMENEALEGFADIELQAPFVHKSKADIVRLGADLGVPFELTWSCYKGGDTHCGACGTCFERREAFEVAGIADPTSYSTEPRFVAPI